MIRHKWIFPMVLLVLLSISCAGVSKNPAQRPWAKQSSKSAYSMDQSAPMAAPEPAETKKEEKRVMEKGLSAQQPAASPSESLAGGVSSEALSKGLIPESPEGNITDLKMESKRPEPEVELLELEKVKEEELPQENKSKFEMKGRAQPSGNAQLKDEFKESERDKEAKKAEEQAVPPSIQEFRIRSRFPEILFFYPNMETNESGEAVIRSSVGDAISTYDISVTAASKKGEWGFGKTSFKTFKPFFIDFDPPRKLHVGDRASFTAALFNYSGKSLEVEIQIKIGSGLTLENNPVRRIKVNPQKAMGLNFIIRAEQYGKSDISISAKGSTDSDSIARKIEIIPAEMENKYNDGGILRSGLNNIDISIPEQAIVSTFKLRVYGGLIPSAIDLLQELSNEPHASLVRSIAYLDSALFAKEKSRELSSASNVDDEIERMIDMGWGRILAFRNGDGFSLYPGEKASPIADIFVFEVMQKLEKARIIDRNVYSKLENSVFIFAMEKKNQLADRLYAASLLLQSKSLTSPVKSSLGNLLNSKQVSENDDPLIQSEALYCASIQKRSVAKASIFNKLASNPAGFETKHPREKSDIMNWRGDRIIAIDTFILKVGIRENYDKPKDYKTKISNILKSGIWGSEATAISKIDSIRALDMIVSGSIQGNVVKSIAFNGKKVSMNSADSNPIEIPINIKPGSNNLAVETTMPGTYYQVVGRYYYGEKNREDIPDINLELPGKIDPSGAFHAGLTIAVPNGYWSGMILHLAIPPGVKPVDNPHELARRVAADYAEVRDSEIILYYSDLESGARRSFIIPMISEIKGEFYIPPPTVESDTSGIASITGNASRVKWI